ncbi:receptor-like protein 13 [Ipomoea triloba]|uniref:receptor-like protein 13 n=1 Tax=Ipomoea triloba TaxID=35885 RepID=UPI00125DF897|nr:receptor-like protein 13 [Ipomoea triloba]
MANIRKGWKQEYENVEEKESDGDEEIVWEEEKPCGDTIELAYESCVDNFSNSYDSNSSNPCENNSSVSLKDNDDLESFTFDDNALINENDDKLHEMVCGDDDVHDDANVCELNDVEFLKFFDDCIDDAMYVHEFLGEVEEEMDGSERDVLLNSDEERENEKREIMVEGVENENDVLESFTFGDESLSNELANDLHEMLCGDDDMNIEVSLCDLIDIELVNFHDNCLNDALYIHDLIGKDRSEESMTIEKKNEEENFENKKVLFEEVHGKIIEEEKEKTRDESVKEEVEYKCMFLGLCIVFVLQWSGNECCVEEERTALHEIKDFFINAVDDYPEFDSYILPSWVDDSDCCNWEQVVCNPITGRVRELTLYGLVDGPPQYCLNMSLFSPFKELINLVISGNAFSCCVHNYELNKLTHLKSLEALNLEGNYFIGNDILGCLSAVTELRSLILSANSFDSFSVLQELSNLTNLESLDLNGNLFTGSLTTQDQESLLKLKKLKHLDLSVNFLHKKGILKSLCNLVALTFLSLESNEIEGTLSNDDVGCLKNIKFLNLGNNQLNDTIPVQAFTSLKNLKVLDLSFNGFVGSIPQAIGNLSALVALSLRKNNLTGILHGQEFCKLKNLEELDLSDNSLEGFLPPCFCNMTSLRLVDLSSNQFRGDFSFIFPSLRSLEYIRLGDNHFHTKFSFSLLANHSKVKLIELLNNDKLEVDTEDSNWIPKFQLEILVLPDCNLNKQSQKVPTFLAYQSMLKVLDLSHNNLRGGFPNWVVKNNTELLVFNLRNNSLEGSMHLQPHLNSSIVRMDVSDNQLDGKLHEDVGRMFPQITYLNLTKNYFEGFVPSSFCNMSQLILLDLSINYFDGEIPKEMVSGCLHNLAILTLSSNRFRGQIFSTSFNMTRLKVLSLEDNQFSGHISNAINRNALIFLDASNNLFSGKVNNWVGNMTNLNILFIRNNSLKGQLPCLIVSHLYLLDISHNSLSGPLPSCPSLLQHVLIQSNIFTGPIPETLLNSSTLVTLDIRDNNLSGNLPGKIGAENLRILLLGGNQLSGPFPSQLCWLQKLNLIDLSHNRLSGQIPRCINNVTFGKSRLVDNFKEFGENIWDLDKVVIYGNILVKVYEISTNDSRYDEVIINFVTKSRSNSYKGDILNLMSGLDLSCNNFTSEIPFELGELTWIHTLNLSHNQIKGYIPVTFSRLRQLESLDLSYNNLTGKIPPELIDLNFLAFFSVAHNNLSGRIPEMKGQFATFDKSSYEGNPYLCGVLLAKKCNQIIESPSSPTPSLEFTSETKWYEMDMLVFWVAFVVAFIIFFLGVVISFHLIGNLNALYHYKEFMLY